MKFTTYNRGFSFAGMIAAIAAFFGVVHMVPIAPSVLPITSTSTEVVANYGDDGTSTAHLPPDNKPGAKLVPANYVPTVDYSKLPVNKPTEVYSGPSDSTSDSATPYIGSIYPNSASVGTTINIKGSDLIGFEGDVYFFFERADGKTIRIPGNVTTQTTGDAIGAQTATIVLKEPCQPGQTVYGDYSGIASTCDYVQLTPGNYKVYTEPWGKKSDVVQFKITN